MTQWSPGRKVLVLGAGATRGAEFVEDGSPICLPPLNADFFTQLQRVTTRKHQDAINAVLADVLRIYGPNYRITLEQYVTQLQSLEEVLDLLPVANKRFTPEGVRAMSDRLLIALSAVLEESADVTKRTSPARKDPCGYHAELARCLDARDTVITFNYDCVMDHALRTEAEGLWSAQYGYCFTNPSRVVGHEAWSAEEPPDEHNLSINLLKLHGSLNWRPLPTTEDDEIRLRERPYKQKGDKEYELVPPETSKRLDTRPVLRELWGKAERALRRARVLGLVGFSFTPTDLHVDSLFRLALAANTQLETVVIVNPNPDHRRAVRAVMATQLERDIRLVQFDTLRDFAPHAKSLLG